IYYKEGHCKQDISCSFLIFPIADRIHIPEKRPFQESVLDASTSLLAVRPFCLQGPTLVHRKVPQRGAFGAETHLSHAPYTHAGPFPCLSHANGVRMHGRVEPHWRLRRRWCSRRVGITRRSGAGRRPSDESRLGPPLFKGRVKKRRGRFAL